MTRPMTRPLSLWAALALLLAAPAALHAAPQYVRLSLMEDGSRSVGVAWNTFSGTPEATVQYGLSANQLNRSATGQVNAVSSTLGSVSEVTLSGLTPSTTYYYRVGGPAGGWSKVYHFTTPEPVDPECGRVSFVVAGDSRAEKWEGDKGSSDLWPQLLGDARARKPDFVVHGGDFVYDGNKQKQYYNLLRVTAGITPYLPVMYTLGNHDDGPGEGATANYNKIFHLPRASKALGGSGTEDYFFFTAGNVLVVSLSTESFSGGTPKFKDQAAWLDKVLSQNKRRWKFVVLHRPIYTEKISIFGQDISHPPNEAGHNAAFVQVFNDHHVDIVFQSHNHFYERFAPSKCVNPGSTKPCRVSSYDKGTVYITTGGGGAFPITCPLVCPGPTGSTRPAASSDHHYVLVDIVNNKLKLQTINNKGKVIDSISITKPVPTPDPCVAPPPPLPDAGQINPDLGGQKDQALPAPDLPGPAADKGTPRKDGVSPPADKAVPPADKAAPPEDGVTPRADTKKPPKPKADKGSAAAADNGGTPAQPPAGTVDGCSCRAGSGSPAGALPLALLALFALWTRRRRRR